MYMRFKDGKDKVVTLSYDDGVVFDKKLIKIMSKYGLKGTFNINTNMYCPENINEEHWRMKLSEAKELYINSGNEIAVHTLNHPHLEYLDETEIIHEVIGDRKNIEKEYNQIAKGMAYPYGTYNNKVINALKQCGISYSRTIKSTNTFGFPADWLELHPTCHHNSPELMILAEKFIGVNRWKLPAMFYLWGHSYEFDNDNNWEVIEKFAEFIGGRDDIWYATNIEIYNYVKAYESLETSYDKKIIHNPSAIDVWVYIDEETVKIKAGETLYR